MKEKRLDYLDMVKGIGIILVVVGHSTYVSDTVLTWLASFHMPLFFLISGTLFYLRQSQTESAADYVKKRFAGMIIPYFWFSLIYIGVDYYYLYAHPELINQAFINNAILQAVSLFGISVLWFLPTIFLGELCFYSLVRKCPDWVIAVIAAVFGMVPRFGMQLIRSTIKMEDSYFNTWLGNLLMALFRVFPAVTFLAIGYFSFRFLEKIKLKRSVEVLLGIGLLLLNAAIAFGNGRVDMHYLVLNNEFLFFAGACSATLGLILICRSIKKLWLLTFLGANSLIVMLTHLDCQVMSTAIRFAVGMNQFIPRAKDIMLRCNLYLSLLLMELVLIFIMNRYLFFLLGRKKPVKMDLPLFFRKGKLKRIK